MTTLSSAQHIALYAQHSLTSTDWQMICQLAAVEEDSDKRSSQLASLSFEQFFGLAVHAFVTAEDLTAQRELAQILPKFGARAVLSLFKILFHSKSKAARANDDKARELSVLSLNSLKNIEQTAFVVGLEDVLSDKAAKALMPLVIEVLASAIREDDGTMLTLLPRLLSAENWRWIKASLLSLPTFFTIQASIQAQQHRSTLTQAVMNTHITAKHSSADDYLACSLNDAPQTVAPV